MGNRKKLFCAFTLAEMMVVMLILSIVLAAFAPVMTTKMKTDKATANSSPWKWANQGQGPHAYFASSHQAIPMAMIGQDNPAEGDNGRLIINTQNDYAHILFKNNGNALARLFIGEDSILFNNSEQLGGSESTALGIGALQNNASDDNTAVGYQALINSSGSSNVAVGAHALTGNTGEDNVAIGRDTLRNNNQNNRNVAIGSSALQANTSGEDNVAVGAGAMQSNTGGKKNVAVGDIALSQNLSGENNVAIGSGALHDNTEESGLIAIGDQALYLNTSGENNTAIGTLALRDNKSGSNNVAIGTLALRYNESGSNNVAIGYAAIQQHEKGSGNVAIGYNALMDGGAPGKLAGEFVKENVAIGQEALKKSYGTGNTAIGYQAMKGKNDGYSRGAYNTAVGHSSLAANTEGQHNVAIGVETLSMNTTGFYNIALGTKALEKNSVGSYNIAIGNNACNNVTSGSNITCIGAGTQALDNSLSNAVYIGRQYDTVYIQGNLVVGGSTVLGARKGAVTYIRGTNDDNDITSYAGKMGDTDNVGCVWAGYQWARELTTTYNNIVRCSVYKRSDRRLKYIGSENKSGLDKIRQLKVFNYTFKKDEKKTPHVGVIAQDLQKVFPNAVKKGEDGFLQIRMEDMFYAVINAIKELDAHLIKIEKTLVQLKNENKQLKKENADLKARLDKIEAKLK